MSAKIKRPNAPKKLPPTPPGYDAWERCGWGGLNADYPSFPWGYYDEGRWIVHTSGGLAVADDECYYIRAIKRPSSKPSPAKAKRAGKPVKAVRRLQALSETQGNNRGYVFVLPADADSVARMVDQVAAVLAGTSGTNMSVADVAEAALAAIGIAGRRK